MGKPTVKNIYLKNKGVSLTEILIVVAILAILGVLGFWAWKTQVFKGYDSRRKTDIYQIKVAIEEYEKDHDCYPPPEKVNCKLPISAPGTGLRPYMDKIPCDPVTKESYYYDYDSLPCPKWYRLYAYLENSADEDIFGSIGPGGTYNYYSGSPNAPEPGAISTSDFYGCKSGICVSIIWDPQKQRCECDPHYQREDCYGECINPNTGLPQNECVPLE